MKIEKEFITEKILGQLVKYNKDKMWIIFILYIQKLQEMKQIYHRAYEDRVRTLYLACLFKKLKKFLSRKIAKIRANQIITGPINTLTPIYGSLTLHAKLI